MPDRPAGTDRVLTIPNALSVVRLGMVFVLLWLAWHGMGNAFLICFVLSLSTDFFDGFLARVLHQQTTLGAQLDSLADISTFLVMPVCAWKLWRDVLLAETPFIVAGVVGYLAPIIYGLIKYGRLPSFHTWGAKSMTVIMSAAVVSLLAGWSPWPLRIFTPFVVLEAIEEIIMIRMLPEWHPNIPGLWKAMHIKKEMAAGMAENS